jgi:hypothetical protein
MSAASNPQDLRQLPDQLLRRFIRQIFLGIKALSGIAGHHLGLVDGKYMPKSGSCPLTRSLKSLKYVASLVRVSESTCQSKQVEEDL